MHIYVDADACPVIRIVENIARKYNIETTLICDTNHVLTSDYSDVVTVSAGLMQLILSWLTYVRVMT